MQRETRTTKTRLSPPLVATGRSQSRRAANDQSMCGRPARRLLDEVDFRRVGGCYGVVAGVGIQDRKIFKTERGDAQSLDEIS